MARCFRRLFVLVTLAASRVQSVTLTASKGEFDVIRQLIPQLCTPDEQQTLNRLMTNMAFAFDRLSQILQSNPRELREFLSG